MKTLWIFYFFRFSFLKNEILRFKFNLFVVLKHSNLQSKTKSFEAELKMRFQNKNHYGNFLLISV